MIGNCCTHITITAHFGNGPLFRKILKPFKLELTLQRELLNNSNHGRRSFSSPIIVFLKRHFRNLYSAISKCFVLFWIKHESTKFSTQTITKQEINSDRSKALARDYRSFVSAYLRIPSELCSASSCIAFVCANFSKRQIRFVHLTQCSKWQQCRESSRNSDNKRASTLVRNFSQCHSKVLESKSS